MAGQFSVRHVRNTRRAAVMDHIMPESGLVHFRTLVILRRVRVRARVGIELRLGLVRVRVRVRVTEMRKWTTPARIGYVICHRHYGSSCS